MIRRDPLKCDGYWEHPLHESRSGTSICGSFIGMTSTNWAFATFVTSSFASTAARQDIVGRAALIDCEYANVVLDEDAFDAHRA